MTTTTTPTTMTACRTYANSLQCLFADNPGITSVVHEHLGTVKREDVRGTVHQAATLLLGRLVQREIDGLTADRDNAAQAYRLAMATDRTGNRIQAAAQAYYNAQNALDRANGEL